MIYEEKTKFNACYTGLAVLLLLVLFAPVFLEIQELFSDEGYYLTTVRELDSRLPLIKVHGYISSGGYPLYSVLVKLLTGGGFSMITALRLLPCLALLLLAGIVFLTNWKAKGLTSGIVGVAALMVNFITIEKFSDGNPVLLGSLGVFSTWMIWFALGVWRGDWKMAWIFSFLIGGLTFYAIGFTGLILIVLPMLFLRRPLTTWTKPRGIAFYLGLSILVLFILLWGIPRWTAEEEAGWQQTALSFPTIGEYLWHLVSFPFDAAIRFMPWTLFVWAPFCPAIVPLDDNPLLSRYLRTLFLGTFVLLWISPLTQSRDMFFMIPPLAVLLALNYWIVVRRYGWKILKFFQFIAVILVILCAAAACSLLIPSESLPAMLSEPLYGIKHSPLLQISLITVTAGLVFALISVVMCARGARIWLTIITLSAAVILPYRGLVIPYQNLEKRKAEVGSRFRGSIPERETPTLVYRMYNIPPLYSEMHYFDIRIKTIKTPEELPEDKPVVYVFASSVPSAPDRTWERLYAEFHRNQEIELWKGKLKTEDDYE